MVKWFSLGIKKTHSYETRRMNNWLDPSGERNEDTLTGHFVLVSEHEFSQGKGDMDILREWKCIKIQFYPQKPSTIRRKSRAWVKTIKNIHQVL
jgi:hypothetical protein